MAQLLLPGPCEDAVEPGAEPNVKNIDCGGAAIAQQMLQAALDVDVRGLCVGAVGGVVCLAVSGQLQSVAAVLAGSYGVFHFCCLPFFVSVLFIRNIASPCPVAGTAPFSLWFTVQN